MLHLINAATFEGFVDEVRQEGRSTVLIMPEYREHPATRVLEVVSDVLRHDDRLDPGRQRWSDRVFVILEDDRHVPLSALWKTGSPCWVQAAVRVAGLLGSVRARRALRLGLVMENGVAL